MYLVSMRTSVIHLDHHWDLVLYYLGIHTQDKRSRTAALKISEKIGISIDIHTKLGSAWSNGKDSEIVPAIRSEIRTLTGAGDVWDAADVIAYLAGLDPRDRLMFANAASFTLCSKSFCRVTYP